MIKAEWNKDLRADVMIIDFQHKNISNLLNDVLLELEDNSISSVDEFLIEDLLDDIKNHFITEERLFLKYNYPYSEQHKSEHKKILLEIEQLKNISHTNKNVILKKLSTFIEEWWNKHVREEIIEFKQFFKDKDIH